MTPPTDTPVERLLQTLRITARGGAHLSYSWHRLFDQRIDAEWVRNLEHAPEMAERLEAFVSRFGRMQDTMAGKLLPRWLLALAERPGSQIETLNRAEQLGVLPSTERWLEARNLRNRLVHEYISDPERFTEDMLLAREYSLMLLDTYNRLRQDAMMRLGIDQENLPEELALPRPMKPDN